MTEEKIITLALGDIFKHEGKYYTPTGGYNTRIVCTEVDTGDEMQFSSYDTVDVISKFHDLIKNDSFSPREAKALKLSRDIRDHCIKIDESGLEYQRKVVNTLSEKLKKYCPVCGKPTYVTEGSSSKCEACNYSPCEP